MMDRILHVFSDPRRGVTVATAVLAVLMAAHWRPMLIPGIAILVLAIVWPAVATRPITWWVMALLWAIAVVVAQDHMEDHVHLFLAWLAALAVSLGATVHAHTVDGFIDRARWQARALVGITFAAAVAWKVYFAQFLTGTALWIFLVVDARFRPLARVVGISDARLEESHQQLKRLLDGSVEVVALDAPLWVDRRIVIVSVLTLALEAFVALAFLVPDDARIARLRLPAMAMFVFLTYAVVPVFLFAALLAVMAVTGGGWRRRDLWFIPAALLVSMVRLATLA